MNSTGCGTGSSETITPLTPVIVTGLLKEHCHEKD
jgi:hypothetical protein